MSPSTIFHRRGGFSECHDDAHQTAVYRETSAASRHRGGSHLRLDGVTKRFGDLPVLEALQLEIPKGQFVAIVGRSGCGKSTLLKLIAGLETLSDGKLSADDQPLSAHRDDTRLMFQEARLLPWKSVLDNVGLGLKGDWRMRALEALREVGLEDKAAMWPSQLSGGQRQRVALARALIHQPRLLLLDEPLGALDALTRLEMHALIEKLWQRHGFTVLLVTHDVPEAVQLADRVIVLEDGHIGLDLEIPLPRPRPREPASPGVSALETQVLHRVLGREDTVRDEAAPSRQPELLS
ncbi:ATP-binding cassette domain-containing protein [Salinicola corii]|uniref:ATP-binding cassette domain-containing protein n=1 Tax=Salinicola corii TaxID=2606937 RepID=A0A640WDL7_9GAMM|nr:ATP-binding cassette domain-containing protein [Salinicola corii]KAA0017491.1 ATP-binding cassette domain-containing protein [Salinicola corii]